MSQSNRDGEVYYDLWGEVDFTSDLSLEELAEHLSKDYFSGLKFGGREEGRRNECPAVYLKFFGTDIVLSADEHETGNFVLDFETSSGAILSRGRDGKSLWAQDYMYSILEDCPYISNLRANGPIDL